MPMEVGPLARFIVNYAAGNEAVVDLTDRCLKKLNAEKDVLFSVIGRILARSMEATLVSEWMSDFYNQLVNNIKGGDYRMFNSTYWEPKTWPKSAQGYAVCEAPRGSVAHYVDIENKKVKRYQMVVPTTWNASPRDPKGQRSAFESSLIGVPVYDSSAPLEIIRTIHSFDPCMACAVHLYSEDGKHIHRMDTL